MSKTDQIVTRAATESAAVIEQFCKANGQLLQQTGSTVCYVGGFPGRQKGPLNPLEKEVLVDPIRFPPETGRATYPSHRPGETGPRCGTGELS